MIQSNVRTIYLVTLLGMGKNLLLAVLKIFSGIIGHSQSLLADGIHSLSDLLIDGLVLIVAKFGGKKADINHPYGHGRIETAAIMLFSFFLALVGVGILLNAGYRIIHPSYLVVNRYLIGVAAISVLCNELIYRMTMKIGRRINSKLMITNAWHHRSDSASSVIVLFGLCATAFGWERFDAYAALIVGMLIIKIAWNFGWQSIRELVDTALDPKTIKKITQTIIQTPGVHATHQIRTRSVGDKVCCDVHILVDPQISVSEGHFISQQVEQRIMDVFPNISDITVHVDPEDDSLNIATHLPTRSEIKTFLEQAWSDLVPKQSIRSARLHYLDNQISIEIFLPLRYASNKKLPLQLAQIKLAKKFITQIKLYYEN